jgi:hypothetical protein
VDFGRKKPKVSYTFKLYAFAQDHSHPPPSPYCTECWLIAFPRSRIS